MSLKSVVLFILSISWLTVESHTLQHAKIKQYKPANGIPNDPEMATWNSEQLLNQPIPYTKHLHVVYNNNTVMPTVEKQKTFFQYQPTQMSRQNVKSTSRKSPRILKEDSNQVTLEIATSADTLAKALTELKHQPVAVLVGDTTEMYKSAMFVIDKLADNLNIRNEFWLMKFNSSGVSNVLAQSKANLDELKNQLHVEINKTNLRLNFDGSEGNAAFFAILKATQILPENSGIIVFLNRRPIDEDISHLTANFGTYPTQGHEEKLLEETTRLTRGYFFLGHNTSGLNEVAKRKEITNVFQDEQFLIQIDNTVKSIDISIKGEFLQAVLVSPQGCSTDLLNITSVQELSFGVSIAHAQHRLANVRFNTTKVIKAPTDGTWELRIISVPNSSTGYNMTISVGTESPTDYALKSQESWVVPEDLSSNDMYFKINGLLTFADKNGQDINSVPYSVIKSMKVGNCSASGTDNNGMSKEQTQIVNNMTKSSNGNETDGSFSRLSHLNQNIQSGKLPSIIIETSTRSELLATPGSYPKIVFEVTNNLDRAIYLTFACQDEKSLLRNLYPRSSWIGPKQTIEVTVDTYVPSGTTLTFTNLITLLAQGQEKGQKSALVYVSAQRIMDTEQPYLTYQFTSNCMEVSYRSCQSGTWTLEVTVQDSQSGNSDKIKTTTFETIT
ncbi:uncharacterized protein CBL_13664 [Carabus blaptoides fortunei]